MNYRKGLGGRGGKGNMNISIQIVLLNLCQNI